MPPPIDDVKNWMNMFRWIVKLIRDEYEVDETILVRSAVLETDCGLIDRAGGSGHGHHRRELSSALPGRNAGRGGEAGRALHGGKLDEGPVQATRLHLGRIRGTLPGVQSGVQLSQARTYGTRPAALPGRGPALDDERAGGRHGVPDRLDLVVLGRIVPTPRPCPRSGTPESRRGLPAGHPRCSRFVRPRRDSDPHTASASRRHATRSRFCMCRGRGRSLRQRSRQARHSAREVWRRLRHRSQCRPVHRPIPGA